MHSRHLHSITRIPDLRPQLPVPDPRSQIPDSRSQIPDPRSQIPELRSQPRAANSQIPAHFPKRKPLSRYIIRHR